MSQKLNGGNFGLTIGLNDVVVVYFWAEWCEPCARYAEIYEAVCSEATHDVIMGKFNVDESKEVAIKAGVVDLPCIFIYKSGEKVGEIIGVNSKQDILEKINSLA